MRQTAQAEGKEEPDAAFEQRLKALSESAKARAQVISCLSSVSAAARGPFRGARITCPSMASLKSVTWAKCKIEKQPAVIHIDVGCSTAGQHCAHIVTLRRSSLCLQSGAGSQGSAEPGVERSMLNAVPDFSAAPLERQRQQPQPGRRELEADSDARSGPSQVSFRLHTAALGRSSSVPNATVEDPSRLKEAIAQTSAPGGCSNPAAGVLTFASERPTYFWSQVGKT